MDYFGLDIGIVNMKVVRLSKSRSSYQLEAAAVAATPSGGMLSENEQNLKAMAEAIKKIRSDAKISTKNVVASLPESEVFTRIVPMPKMSMRELDNAIAWEAEQYIPLPMSDVNYSYSVVSTKPDGSMDVLIVAAPIRLVEKYERVLKLAGLTTIALETELLAASRSVAVPNQGTVMMLVDLGARSTDMSIISDGNVVFTRSIGTAGEALTRALMTNLQLDENQAESFKRSYGLDQSALEGKVSTALKQVVDLLGSEITRTISFFSTQTGKKVQMVQLVGGSSLMPNLVSWLTGVTGTEVQVGNVLLHVDDKGRGSQIQGLPMYAVAIGLAMKDV